jgi:hypothetical protein
MMKGPRSLHQCDLLKQLVRFVKADLLFNKPRKEFLEVVLLRLSS